MDSNLLSNTEKAHLMVDISKMIENKESLEANNVHLKDSDLNELKSTISYSIALKGDKKAEEDKKAQEDKEKQDEEAKKKLEEEKNQGGPKEDKDEENPENKD